jgi:hypothetical protein
VKRPGALSVFLAACLLLAGVIAFATFSLAWNPRPRLVLAVLPGAYFGAFLNRLLRLPSNGAGVWVLFFIGNVLFYFVILVGIGAAVARLHSRGKIGANRV